MGINLGKRIKLARSRAGLTQAELSQQLGITYPTLNKYERGHRMPGAELISRMAKLLECDPGWLVSGEGGIKGVRDVPGTLSITRTPVLSKVPDDFPGRVSDVISEYISLPDVTDESYALIVKGDSMHPVIKDGDYLIFIPVEKINNGDIVIVNDEWGETIPRRYRERNRRAYLASDNPDYPVLRLDNSHTIIGKVTAVWRKVKI